MKKLISLFLVFAVTALTLCTFSLSAAAIGVDSSVPSSLTIHYKSGETDFAGIEVATYHVANINADTTLTLAGDFASYPVNINAITSNDEWLGVTSTLLAYVTADGIEPTYTATTDENGTVCFENIPQGLYLTLCVVVNGDELVTVFKEFLTIVPTYGAEYNYDVVAYPKSDSFVPIPDDVEFKVVKQWKDNGHTEKRPKNIEVMIYKNGDLFTTQTLNSENNWSYTWRAPDDGSIWTAVEKYVPEEYTVTVVVDGRIITLTNTYDSIPDLPQTGDTSVIWHYVLIAIASGFALVLIATRRRKLDTYEQ